MSDGKINYKIGGRKLIYIYSLPNVPDHKGCVKIGDTTCDGNVPIEELTPGCEILEAAARKRMKKQLGTSGMLGNAVLHYTELAINNKGCGFRDVAVHAVLEKAGKKRKKFKGAGEWFQCSVADAKAAILSVKQGRTMTPSDFLEKGGKKEIVFRPEQKEAIEKTVKAFKTYDEFLWDAKMRFGKTFCALEVVKKMRVKKTIIYTHRPVVDQGWRESFYKIFESNEIYLDKSSRDISFETIDKFVYFASLQDLRGSGSVGGKFDKNQEVFKVEWDLVIIDEAHEGTQTDIAQKVFEELVNNHKKKKPKVLHLSGTPFNIQGKFSDAQTYVWSYLDEQRAKEHWDIEHPDEQNPYETLPEMKIFTIDIARELVNENRGPLGEAVHFSFSEFFKVWRGDLEKDGEPVPAGRKIGDFVRPKDVKKFLQLICKKDEKTEFPFSTEGNRALFNHTLWIVPGVAEAKALEKLMAKTPPFVPGNNFKIINIAGDGNRAEDEDPNALNRVKDAIKANHRTVTISCGRLTTGTTVPEWSAVLMLNGGNGITSVASYLQTIFRVQSPWKKDDGWYKTECYVFDFSPNRALNCIAKAAGAAMKADPNKDPNGQRVEAIKNFINYCPIVALDGNGMKTYSPQKLMETLRQVKIEQAVFSGFDDESIYNYNELVKVLKFNPEALKFLNGLTQKIGQTKQTKKIRIIEISTTPGIVDPPQPSGTVEIVPQKTRSDDDTRKKIKNLIATLRGISIRIPIMIYGADIDGGNEITLENFTKIIDDKSWDEFMPKGITKDDFEEIKKYYDAAVFVGAGNKIRDLAKEADNFTIFDRVCRIAEIFSYWRNPDKETVLTPWRVVNMHMSETLGGNLFYEKEGSFNKLADAPCYVDNGKVSRICFNPKAKILEINSKTGLYPLYLAYSIYRSRVHLKKGSNNEKRKEFWNQTLAENIFVVCKTKMAENITKRTLAGFTGTQTNIITIENIDTRCGDEPKIVVNEILNHFNKKTNMKFNAIVGNPPYQVMDGGAQASARPVYQNFVRLAKALNPEYISLIMPARWMTGGRGLDDFREEMIHDKHIIVLHDHINSSDCFPTVDIKGGVCYFLRSREEEKKCDVVTYSADEVRRSRRFLADDGEEIFIRDDRMISIKNKAMAFDEESFSKMVSSQKPYGLRGDVFTTGMKKYNLPDLSDTEIKNGYKIIGLGEKQKRVWKYVSKNYPFPRKGLLDNFKIFITRNYGCGVIGEVLATPVLATPVLATPGAACTETFVEIGPFDTEIEMKNAYSYFKTKFFRFLVGICKQDQSAAQRVYKFVPIQDFGLKSDIDWSKSVPEIDLQLYKKYDFSPEEIGYIESVILPME